MTSAQRYLERARARGVEFSLGRDEGRARILLSGTGIRVDDWRHVLLLREGIIEELGGVPTTDFMASPDAPVDILDMPAPESVVQAQASDVKPRTTRASKRTTKAGAGKKVVK